MFAGQSLRGRMQKAAGIMITASVAVDGLMRVSAFFATSAVHCHRECPFVWRSTKKHFPNRRLSYIIEYSGLENPVMIRSKQKKSALCGLFVSKQLHLDFETNEHT